MRRDLNAEIKKKQAELDRLIEERDELQAMTPEKQLAVQLHDLKCNWNHTDGCGWYYEFDKGEANWNGHAHKRYLEQAQAVMKRLPNRTVEEILEIAAVL